MGRIIYGVQVNADHKLLEEEIQNIVLEEMRAWTWEGKKLGKVDLIVDGEYINIYSYENPLVKQVHREL